MPPTHADTGPGTDRAHAATTASAARSAVRRARLAVMRLGRDGRARCFAGLSSIGYRLSVWLRVREKEVDDARAEVVGEGRVVPAALDHPELDTAARMAILVGGDPSLVR